MFRLFFCFSLMLVLAGCANVPQRAPAFDIGTALQGREEITAHLMMAPQDAAVVVAHVDRLLGSPLTSDGAVELALLASPDIKAAALSLAAEWAEVQHAGTLSNPEIDMAALLGAGPALLEFGLMQSLTSILTRKKRLRAAESRYEVVVQQVVGQILSHAQQTRLAVANYRNAMYAHVLLADAVEVARAAVSLADSMVRAGNMPASDHLMYQLERNDLERDLLDARQAEQSARMELARLMGILTLDQDWQLASGDVQPVPLQSVADLFQRARQTRPDLAVRRAQLLALAADRKLVNAEHVLPHLSLGGVVERDDGEWKGGPALSLELPIFDTGTADRRRFDAQLRAVQMSYLALEQASLADISALHGDVLTQQARLHLAEEHVALTDQLLSQMLRKYNYMLAGSFDVLEARRQVLSAQQNLSDTQSAYMRAVIKLQMAVGDSPFVAAPETGDE